MSLMVELLRDPQNHVVLNVGVVFHADEVVVPGTFFWDEETAQETIRQ